MTRQNFAEPFSAQHGWTILFTDDAQETHPLGQGVHECVRLCRSPRPILV